MAENLLRVSYFPVADIKVIKRGGFWILWSFTQSEANDECKILHDFIIALPA